MFAPHCVTLCLSFFFELICCYLRGYFRLYSVHTYLQFGLISLILFRFCIE
ncbi:hypothetical protein ACOSP7_026867 [Xanthoceras sorbifolium]